MTFSEAVSTCFSKYATFQGRAARSEYWWFYLFCVIVGTLAGVLDRSLFGVQNGVLSSIISLALIVPMLAAGTRRLHDIDRSGWWQLLSLTIVGIIVLIVWWVRPGTAGANSYGPATGPGASGQV